MPAEKQFDVDKVLDKAMRAFWARGYGATSMQDLVDCTGVNRGSLYATYGDKHTLFLAALRMYDETMRKKMLEDFETRFAAREAIRRLFLAFSEQASPKGCNRGCFLTNTALELAAHDKEARHIVAEAQTQIEAFFARMIRKGQESGDLARHMDPSKAASGLLASLAGLVVLIRSRPEPALLQAVVDDAIGRLG